MKHTVTTLSPTRAKVEITLDSADLAPQKAKALQQLAKRVKVSGFRPGKTPTDVAEKHVDPMLLQQEVVEGAVNANYIKALMEAQVQPLDRPQIEIKKFVPYDTLEFSAEVEVVPKIKLADYTKMKKELPKTAVKVSEVNEVIERLRQQLATKKEVERAAKDADEVIINFTGKDDKGAAIKGASGNDYPLRLGSKSFIDGFEENLVGLKPLEQKEFTLTFPKDYGHAPLQNKKVTFTVTVKRVNETTLPAVDDAFAKQVGPFETLAELKKDVKQELTRQQEQSARNQLKNEVVEDIIAKSDVPLPQTLVDDQARMVQADMTQNLAYRGMTLKDYLESEKLNEEEWKKKEVTPAAKKRVATGLILSEIAKNAGIDITDEEVDQRVTETKQQMQDPKMRAQLDTPEARRDLASRAVTEKTLDHIVKTVSSTKS
jgi:trigger factor